MTRQPHKQRTRTRNASLHERHDQVRATLSEDLREEYDQRSVRVNAGDTVEVLRGDDAGTEAEVLSVDLRDAAVHVEDVTVEKGDGEEVPRPLDASNLRVTDLNLEDERREARLEGES
jgi:large subunit ribosomal protein L24